MNRRNERLCSAFFGVVKAHEKIFGALVLSLLVCVAFLVLTVAVCSSPGAAALDLGTFGRLCPTLVFMSVFACYFGFFCLNCHFRWFNIRMPSGHFAIYKLSQVSYTRELIMKINNKRINNKKMNKNDIDLKVFILIKWEWKYLYYFLSKI